MRGRRMDEDRKENKCRRRSRRKKMRGKNMRWERKSEREGRERITE